ncbi:MAG: hypothetical protein M3N08_03205 [Pseudomonadota bacterium]|nr:hypothetical protein [Pseudomonadota bacterium]
MLRSRKLAPYAAFAAAAALMAPAGSAQRSAKSDLNNAKYLALNSSSRCLVDERSEAILEGFKYGDPESHVGKRVISAVDAPRLKEILAERPVVRQLRRDAKKVNKSLRNYHMVASHCVK